MNKFHDANTVDLTDRERQVVRGVCLGFSNKRIGAELGITLSTVKNHLSHITWKIFHKRFAYSRVDIVRRYLKDVEGRE